MEREITVKYIREIFKDKIVELQEEPAFQWDMAKIKYGTEESGDPLVKLAVANVPLDYDLWKGLRNPAVVGQYPMGLQEIWEFYANRNTKRVDEFGRQTIFQIPKSFDFARKNYRRAVIISVMLPFSQKVIKEYAQIIVEKRKGSSHVFSRMYEDINLMIDKATSRVALDLFSDDTVVVPMDNNSVKTASAEAMPLTRQRTSHGPCKDVNYPQKSVAALVGLGQFGIMRIIFRDEISDGKVQRFVGPLRSMIVFDKENLVKDGTDGIIYPTEAWREFLFNLFDFTVVDPEVNKCRFCTYMPSDDEGCGKCISHCPSGAQANSVPTTKGIYSERISEQTHRFWDGKLQFDFARCCEDRGQMTTLFPEWSCARCVSICASKGNTRMYAVENFYKKMHELTKD